jgi:hypothetical protein
MTQAEQTQRRQTIADAVLRRLVERSVPDEADEVTNGLEEAEPYETKGI